MRKICLFLTVMLMGVFMLFSCDGEDAPDGLQKVYESPADGYTMYGPEGWVVANRGGIAASYVTAVNNTSITFVKAERPTGSVGAYFDESMATLPYSINIVKRDELCSFGNADAAYKYIYTYKYMDYDFACMQILVERGEDFYIFTYNSYGDVNDESSDYRSYLEAVQLSIDNFRFTEKSEAQGAPDYEKGGDGYMLVSDKGLCGFDLYLPEGCEVFDNSAIVSAKIAEGATVSLSKASGTGVSIGQYWKNRKDELSRLVSSLNVISENVINGDGNSVALGDLAQNRVAAYEYTYVYGGTTYHVYQVFGVDSFNGYSFTYTATEAEYAENLDTVKTILEKVRF